MARRKRELKESYIILVDGKSEILYLNLIKTSNVKVLPEIPKKKSLQDMYELFKSKLSKADNIYWIVDLDVVIKENNLHILQDYLKHYKDNIIINNPCLEYWFYLHYKSRGNFSNRCDDVIKALKKEDDLFRQYTKCVSDIEQVVKLLESRLETAYKNAQNRPCDLEELLSCSQMDRLIKKLKG
jgi:hypothetical protein